MHKLKTQKKEKKIKKKELFRNFNLKLLLSKKSNRKNSEKKLKQQQITNIHRALLIYLEKGNFF